MENIIDLGLVRGLITLAVFGAFIALVFWAYSGRRRPDFDALSRLPLETDAVLESGVHLNEKEARHD